VVLDYQLALTRESAVPAAVRAIMERLDGSETTLLGEGLGAAFRAYARPGSPALAELRQLARGLQEDPKTQTERRAAWATAVQSRLEMADPARFLWPLSQDAAFAAPLARRFVTVGGILGGIRETIRTHVREGQKLRALDEGAPLAQSHGTRYPIVQGPMTRVSDVPEFSAAVAGAGGLPFVAAGLLRDRQLHQMLDDTKRRLGALPWGVGLLGFVPNELCREQFAVVQTVRPPFALIAGGRPDQVLTLERDGIPTYLHVPSPALLRLFVDAGVRRFVFEGRECGGHVGPLSSFVLWNAMVDGLLEALPAQADPHPWHVLFAGGIHDARSASMVAALSAPLASRGVKVGVLLGTAYLFTREAVETGAITPAFLEEALRCGRTALLESGPGHASRCAVTPFVETFARERRSLEAEGKSAEQIRESLDRLTLGRLRIAAKGISHAETPGLAAQLQLPEDDQRRQGMFMIGQVAALRTEACSVEAVHRQVSVEASERIAQLPPLAEEPGGPALPRPCDVAVVGMACLMPKAASVGEFWANILSKVDAITEIPEDRFDWRRYYDPTPGVRDKICSKWGGFLDPIAFDPMRYGMPPATLSSIEPMQLMVLEVVRAALQDAGYSRREFDRERTGVVFGVGGGTGDLGQQYCMRAGLAALLPDVPAKIWDALPVWTEDSFAGIILNVTAGRVANRFDFGGVNYTVDAACASSLAALHAGVQELQAGTTDTMVVGGADTVQNPFGYLCFSSAGALSPGGRCRPFDEHADGIVIGEGIAVVVLKRLADAERDGDRIYAVIKGVAGSSDGRDRSMTAPRPEGQMRALQRAYAAAGVSPASVGLIEAHGTGTAAGDRAEIESLTRVFGPATSRPQSCAVGSVKSMIGHTKCAAGLAGLIKVAKALYHRTLPPTMGVETPNGQIRFSEGPFYLNAELRPWLASPDGQPRRAGVSAFGFGGTNFHAVLEEYTDAVPASVPVPVVLDWPAELFLCSGETRDAVCAAANTLLARLDTQPSAPLRTLAAGWWDEAAGRQGMPEGERLTLALVAGTREELRDKLTSAHAQLQNGAAAIHDPRGVYFSSRPQARSGQIGFLFPGQGSQRPDMLRDLAVHFEEVRSCFETASRCLADRFPKPLGAYVFPPPRFSPEEEQACEAALTQTQVAQPALGAAGIAMATLLRRLGVTPAAAAGHSYGEYVALCAAGALSPEQLYRLSEARGRVIVESADTDLGTMAAVHGGRAEVAAALDGVPGVWIANLNTPRQTIISGTRAGVEAGCARLNAAGLTTRAIAVACAFHSPLMEKAAAQFAQQLQQVPFAAPSFPVFSNTSATAHGNDPQEISGLLAQHMLNPVRFAEELEAMYASGCRVFVEVGPRNVLSGMAQQVFQGREVVTIATDAPGRDGVVQLLHALGQMATQGVALSLDRLFAGRSGGPEPEDSRPPSAPLWLVSGGRARPVNGQPVHRAPSLAEEKRMPPAPPSGLPRAPVPAQAAVPPLAVSTPPQSVLPPTPWAAPAPEIPMPSAGGSAGDVPDVLLQFQRVMTQFLQTQRNVMLAYLGATPAPETEAQALPGADRRRVGRVRSLLPVRLVDETGRVQTVTSVDIGLLGVKLRVQASLPAGARVTLQFQPPDGLPMLSLASLLVRSDPDGQAFCFVDVKPGEMERMQELVRHPIGQAEADGGPQVVSAVVRSTDLAAPPAPSRSPAVASGLSRAALQQMLLKLVADRTGYPTEMLALEANLEADLGIDSIKRVEILGAVQQQLPAAVAERVRGSMETVTRAKTLAAILDVVAPLAEAAAPADGPSPAPTPSGPPQPLVPPREIAAPIEEPARYLLETQVGPAPPEGVCPVPQGVILVTEDTYGIARGVTAALRRQGARVVLVTPGDAFSEPAPGEYRATFASVAETRQLVQRIRETHGALGGLLHLAPVQQGTALGQMDLSSWRTRLRTSVKSLFWLAQAAGPDLVRDRAGFVMAVTGQGGKFGLADVPADHFPGDGGVAGLVKTLAVEWPQTWCRVLDVNRADPAEQSAERVMRELANRTGAAETEIGWSGNSRVTLRLRAASLRAIEGAADGELLGPDSVVLVTGGARGITSEIAEVLARRWQPTLILVGRGPLPTEESAATAGLTTAQDVKAALIPMLRQAGAAPKPADVERAYAQILRDREVRQRLAAVQATGARVIYRQVDTRDPAALTDLVGDLYRTFGRVDGVVHGAGVIEDKLVLDKDPESFDRVFDTKADGTFVLARCLRLEALKFFVIFSSVAGRFGNRGQSDYVAANEVLNKLAGALDRQCPGRVVALDWGPWGRSGMVQESVARQFAARGVELVTPALGCALFLSELAHGKKGEAEVVLGRGPWGARRDAATSAPPALPLLGGSRGASTRAGLFEEEYVLDPATELYLGDHLLDGKPVFPAAMAMELMAEAAQRAASGLVVVGLESFRLFRGIVLENGPKPILVSARALPDAAGETRLEVSLADRADGRPCYRATVLLDRGLAQAATIARPPLVGLRPFAVPVDEAYRRWLFQGPIFQGIVAIQGIGEDGMLATLRPSSPARCLRRAHAGAWLIDPVVVDSAFQLAILWARAHTDMTPLPAGFRRYHRFAPLRGESVEADLRVKASAGGQVLEIEVAFLGPDGRLLGFLQEMQLACSRSLNRLAGSQQQEHPS
jgi:acyl transferase domain-containing protein/NAD(P)H-dependent flavin oxidoreductase YrpB (nitropropane dioxygenase family)